SGRSGRYSGQTRPRPDRDPLLIIIPCRKTGSSLVDDTPPSIVRGIPHQLCEAEDNHSYRRKWNKRHRWMVGVTSIFYSCAEKPSKQAYRLERSIRCSIRICKMGTLWRGHTVIIMCDNAVVVNAINARSVRGQTIDPLQLLLLTAPLYDIEIASEWLSSEDNWIADAILNLTRLLTCSYSSKTAPPIV